MSNANDTPNQDLIKQAQDMLNNFSLGDIPPEFTYALLGFCIGGLIATILGMVRRQKLMAKNAALEVQLEAERDALDRAGEVLDHRFKVAAQDALKTSNEHFLQLANERLKAQQADSAYDLEKRQRAISELLKPMRENLQALSGAIEQVKGTDMALREDLKHLSKETSRLVGALRDPSAQGVWGEFILEGILEKSGLMKGVHYETQVSMQTETGRQRPDALIHMQDGFKIVVDAKAPINEFVQHLNEDLTQEQTNTLTNNLARAVRDHVKKLGSKNYWESVDNADFTVMFLPSEHIYSMALRADPQLVDFAAANNIIIASPTLLLSLLRVVGVSWKQVELAKNAIEISEQGQHLYKRLLTFTSHLEKAGKGIEGAMDGYNKAIGSLERQVLPAARKFKDLQVQNNQTDLPEFEAKETNVRQLSLSVEDENEKKRA